MFCANCGSKLPDGSNFCSVCGAKIQGLDAPEPFNNKRLENDPAKTQAVSFDWSNVKDEPHKKSSPKVHSPWGTTELSNRDFFDSEDYAPNEEYSRTMSFIDLLKKERDERAQAAAEEARQYTDKEETPYDYSAFEEAPSYYVPPLYEVEDDEDLIQDRTPRYGKHSKIEDDYEDDVENTKLEVEVEPEDDDTDDTFDIFDTTDIPEISDTDTFADTFAETLEEIEIPEIHEEPEKAKTIEDTLVMDYIDIPDIPDIPDVPDVPEAPEVPEFSDKPEIPEISEVPEVMDAFNAFESSEPTEEIDEIPEYLDLTQPFEKEIAAMEAEREPESLENLDSEIADILAVGSGKIEEEKEIDLFDSADVEPELIEDSKPIEEAEPILEEEPILEPESELESELISEIKPELQDQEELDSEIELEPDLPLVDEVEDEEEPLIELLPEEDEEVVPVEETEALDLNSFFEPEPIVEPAAEPVVELPEVSHEEEIDEEAEMDDLKQRLTDLMGYSPSAEEVAEATEELLIQEITDEEEEEEDEAIELELGDEESDAIPVDEIERELFGETTDEDIEAEATKKIDKFYTLYKKNEEFQKLLDEEYNKLKTEDGVPHVDELLAEEPKVKMEKFEEETVAPSPIPEVKEEPKQEESKKEEPKKEESKKEEKPKKEKVKKEKPSKNKDAEGEGVAYEGGNKLTIVAVILAALLVIVLAMIIVMYVAPYSGLAIKIDSIIQTFSSLFSSVGTGTYWLL